MFCTFNTTGSYFGSKLQKVNVNFENFGKTNDYTDEQTILFKNYNYLVGSGTAFTLHNFTGTIYCLCIGGGGGTPYIPSISGSSSGGAGAVLLATYNLTNVTDTVSYDVAGMTPTTTTPTSPSGFTVGLNGNNSTVTWANNPTNNLKAYGGSSGQLNRVIGLPNGNGSIGGCGKNGQVIPAANLTRNQPDTTTSSIYNCFSKGGSILTASNTIVGGGGSGAGSQASDITTYLYKKGEGNGGDGIKVPAGYGISTHYYYAGGPAGSCSNTNYEGVSGKGGASAAGSANTVTRTGTSSGYGATDNAGTNGVTNNSSDSVGGWCTGPSAVNSGSGAAAGGPVTANSSDKIGQGASGIIIFSLLASSIHVDRYIYM
jgi:hypothetical protein